MALRPAASTTCATSVAADGRVLRFVHNWNWEQVEFTVPAPVRDLLSDQAFEAGDKLSLGAWDVRILVEERSTLGG